MGWEGCSREFELQGLVVLAWSSAGSSGLRSCFGGTLRCRDKVLLCWQVGDCSQEEWE